MLETSSWTCDTCGKAIEKADHGWVEWICINGRQGRDLRLVHHKPHSHKPGGCQFDTKAECARDEGIVSDLSLGHFMGHDGLMHLLSMICEDTVPSGEVIEMIKRVHIPGYEWARAHLGRAISEGVYEPNTHEQFPWQSDIESVHAWLDKGGE